MQVSSQDLTTIYTLKQNLIDFVLDAEDELAKALENYAAKQVRRGFSDNLKQDTIVENFAFEGDQNYSPIDLFLQTNPQLSESEKNLIKTWHQSFMGLFAVNQILADGFEVMNWLTAKNYLVKPDNQKTQQELSRLKVGEIIHTRLIPITSNEWTFANSYILMGKLGKPKLAVAIGNFKDNYKQHLYSDAPELLTEAWESVEIYHQEFQDFFHADEVTMSGYQLSQNINEFQEIITKKRLEAAGIDPSKSFAEIIETSEEQEEIINRAAEAGVDQKLVSQILNSKTSTAKMITPKVDLPAEIKKADEVTAISDPRWGQMFLATYTKMKSILAAENWRDIEGSEKLIRFYLEDKSINSLIWHRLAEIYPRQLESILREILNRPEFKLVTELNLVLEEFNKFTEPDLPETASVPTHLHNLFQEAFAEVNKSKTKGKAQKVTTKGFQRN
ncbi:hypothetical protein [Calothrix sp. PCC 6303]|uniref:hypothetical protein n=1 Tax=Calothrix sp. PCC 6303 TaxID=1170562 RepID=UPI0002A01695|nr:hypothetical protein [Calothrix sp. PCC 6303]AFZ00698.1 hypothetical protein Cal6303_1656 [Calothrix sp. PCC 6303]